MTRHDPSCPLFLPPCSQMPPVVSTSQSPSQTINRVGTKKRKKGILGFMSIFFRASLKDEIGFPEDPVHLTHVGRNHSTGELTGLPKEWQQLLRDGGFYGMDRVEETQVVADTVRFYARDAGDVRGKTRAAPPPPHDKAGLAGGLRNSERPYTNIRVRPIAPVNFGRVIPKTTRTPRMVSHVGYNEVKAEGLLQGIQQELDPPVVQKSPPYERLIVGAYIPHSIPVELHDTSTIHVSKGACGRLIRRAFTLNELPSLIEAIFSDKDERDAIHRLLRDDAQNFIDVIDEALDRSDILPWARKKCLKSLYKTCGRHALLPKNLKIPVCYDRTSDALYRGGFADVWKGEYYGREVAVKVLRTYSNSDFQKIIGRFCKEVVMWKALRHPNVLPLIGVTMTETRFAMVSDWMANGNINDFVKAHPDVDRLGLLIGVAQGLIYIHSQGMIHGDLKGANILIDQTGNALLADFGLLTIVSDPTNLFSSSSYAQGGTARWMGPELINPQQFGLKDNRATKSSDCYALGMVIYETISGKLPFHQHGDLTVFTKVLAGERPVRGVEFTESLWRMLRLCWKPQPNNRPRIEDVLLYLERVSNS
ncbi:kinase-like protein [Thelephora ganbajun]|uniref:Kinase-like protein n=1 Tax=Thelephora ganbajun TaxID=370292 RepID=A0ACB6Z5X7_THEGA|nr:kinase-like protein [Thelephora ganbajun]